MDDQERKTKLILILILICPLLIVIQIGVVLLKFGGPLHILLFVPEFILAVCGLLGVHGWHAPTWKRLCVIGIMLTVICWTLFWPIAFVLFLPGMRPNP